MTAPTEDPLTLSELAAILGRIGGFEARPLVAVAVSGGPDSMALVLLADRWAKERGGEAWGLTVDHGLRPESAAEARTVALWLAARAIRHQTLVWRGNKPASGIQEAAREERYRLLAKWCRDRGCLHLLTAHHREDQRETHLIRRRAGSGPDGLAGMSAVRELAGCRLVRPLLAVPRARLRAVLAAEDQPFIDDPSNRNPRFERARLRLNLPGEAAAELPALGRARIAREAALAPLLACAVSLHPAGFAVVDPAAVAASDDDTAERLLGRVAAAIGGAPYPARRARLARLRGGLAARPERPRTLGGCRFVPWRGRLLVMRELAAAAPPVSLAPGAELLWDRRFAVAVPPATSPGVILGYLGQSPFPTVDREAGALPRLLHSTLPAFWDAAGIAAVPHLGWQRPALGAWPGVSFRPANPLSRVSFTVV
jgi:tRNA(Ile)-lysidine synthase